MTLLQGDSLPAATDGALPVRQAPADGWPQFDEESIAAVERVLRSGRVNYWTGDEGRRFEAEFAAFVGTRHAIALANGTLALEAAVRALGIGRGDEVITTSRTFIASANAVVGAGAVPVFADVDQESGVITEESVRAVLSPRTRAILAVHLAGWPCDVPALMALAVERGIFVIEDCAQAHGARFAGRSVGSMGHVAAWSFCQDKILSTGGEGGMLTTNDTSVWSRAWALKDHGKSYDAVHHREWAPGFRWLHEGFGSNWRMTEMQSAIGRVVLRRLPDWVRARRRHAAVLDDALRGLAALRVTIPPELVEHAYYKYYAYVRPGRLREGWSRDRIMEGVTALGTPCYSGTCSEIYLERCYQDAGLVPARPLPVARELGETSLMLEVHPTLSDTDVGRAAAAMRRVVEAATA